VVQWTEHVRTDRKHFRAALVHLHNYATELNGVIFDPLDLSGFMCGILAVDRGFELLCGGSPAGRRRHLDDSAVSSLKGFSDSYVRPVSASGGLLVLGRDLYSWLDGDGGQLTALLQQADRPLRFEVCAANRYPGEPEWALLRAPLGAAGRRERLPGR
jgi:hypothetical protein